MPRSKGVTALIRRPATFVERISKRLYLASELTGLGSTISSSYQETRG
jgi:hypothetical protein